MAEFCLDCMKKHDSEIIKDKQVIESLSPDLCEGCGLMKPVVIHVLEKTGGLTLLERLDKAKIEIEKSYKANDSKSIGELAGRFKDLYVECYNLEDESRERHYAEYLKLMILLHFTMLFDGGGDSAGLYDSCSAEAYKARLRDV